MKKFKIFAVIILAFVLVYGFIQVCFADAFNVDIEGQGDNVKLVFTINGKKYELSLNTYTGDVTRDKDSTKSNTEKSTGFGITLEEAKEIAEKDATVTAPAYKKEKTDSDDGRKVYEIEFIYDNKEYSYEIDAESGKILEKDIDYDIDYNENNYKNNSGQYNITSEEAENIALKDAGVSRTDVKYINSHIDRDDGLYVYEVEFVVDNMEYDYEINSDSGVILSSDMDRH